MPIARFLRIALICELEFIAAAFLAAATFVVVVIVDRSTELQFTVYATVSGCAAQIAEQDSLGKSGPGHIGSQSGPTTLRSVGSLKPLAFLSDLSGSTVTLSVVSKLRAAGCQVMQVRTTGPDLATATSVWFWAYACLALSLIVVAWARMPAGEGRPRPARTTGRAVQAAVLGIGLGALAILVFERVVVDTLATPAVVDDAISALAGSLAFMGVAVIVAPVAEEVWFRRFWLERFAAHHGGVLGSVFVTAMFCALHVPGSAHPLASVLSAAALSGACCIAYLRSRSVVPPLLLHAAYNATIVISQS